MTTNFTKATGYSITKLRQKNRRADLSLARQAFYKFMRGRTNLTFQEIGDIVGVKHSSVIQGIARINGLLEIGDAKTVEMWDKLKNINSHENKR